MGKIAALTSTLLLLFAIAATGAPAAERAHYVELAKDGVSDARRHWWNSRHDWYDDRLANHASYPLATIWSIVPLFEAVDALAIAKPTAANRRAVRRFADAAERYWNPNMGPYGAYSPYPGGRSSTERTWFDDNAWWGLGFVDAYRATKDRRYLKDAARASRFIDARGWDGAHGMWWNTDHPHHSLEAWASATALAAELYRYTGNAKYRRLARKYIRWGNRHATESQRGLYATKDQGVMSYVQGPLIGAHLALCKKGDDAACRKARQIAQACFEKWEGGSPDHAPQFDTILMRYLVQLSAHDRDPTWYDWVRRVADRAERRSRSGGLWLRFWDGSKATSHGDGAGGFQAGMVQTHAATVALFAWLGTIDRPPGPARALPREAVSRPGWETWITVERIHEDGDPVCYVQGHIRGWTAKATPYRLEIELDEDGDVDARDRDGTTRAGQKTTGVVTVLKRRVGEPGSEPMDVTVTGTVGGRTYTSHRRLDPPWC